MSVSKCILIVGLGSPHGDDQIGWRVADAIQELLAEAPNVTVRKGTVPLDLLDWLEGIERLHICDACCSSEPVGTLLRLDVSPPDGDFSAIQTLSHLRSGSSHDFGLGAVLGLAARLGRLPETVVVHAVSGCRFEPGATMMDGLADAVPKMARTILEELTDARSLARAVTAASG